jgi:catechol 2,3-dioxygenase-like lactoylglutathione lyase family enzyme
MNPKIAVVSLWAEDVPATAHFYRDAVGLQLLLHHDRPHFKVGDSYLTILQGKPVPALGAVPPHFPLVAFAVENLDAAVERLKALHVELPWDIEQDPGSRWIKFFDPAGNLVELVQFE